MNNPDNDPEDADMDSPPMSKKQTRLFQRALYSSIKASLGLKNKNHEESDGPFTQPEETRKVSSVVKLSLGEVRKIKVSA